MRLSEACFRLGMSRERLMRAILTHRLEAVQDPTNGRWSVAEDAIKTFEKTEAVRKLAGSSPQPDAIAAIGRILTSA